MEDSFFEYRDKTAPTSDSDSEFIDNSLEEVPFSAIKKNKTVFVAESEDSSEDDSETQSRHNLSKLVVQHGSIVNAHVISSSDEDASRKGSIRRQMDTHDKVVLSSSDEENEDVSPELIPKRRPPVRPKSIDSNDSIIVRKTKKRIFLVDSDTDNSIVVEHKKHNKITCLKDTPLKIESNVKKITKDADKSMDYDDDNSDSNDDTESNVNEDDIDNDNVSKNFDEPDNEAIISKLGKNLINENTESIKSKPSNLKQTSSKEVSPNSDDDYFGKDSKKGNENYVDHNTNDDENEDYEKCDDSENSDVSENGDGSENDEDLMVMSRATRMSIMGVIPKDDESDDSDYIQSDESARNSKDLSDLPEVSIAISRKDSFSDDLPEVSMVKTPKKSFSDDLPEVSIVKTPEKLSEQDGDTSKLTCSPFSSPLHDITNELNKSSLNDKSEKIPEVIDLSIVDYYPMKSRVLNKLANSNSIGKNGDDDVTIIETKPEIIALSSDDEDDDEVRITEKKSPRKILKSPKLNDEVTTKREAKAGPDIKQYLAPPSYPNQVVYVKQHVRENELNKLMGLKEDLNNVRLLLEEMDMDSLPDGGSKLIERLSGLEAEVRRQGDRVANMVVEPDAPTAQDIAKDGFDKGLSWEDIQKASNAVQPRMFGKQAMATHMAERNLIIDRLRDLHESLASRPSESTLAASPRIMSSELMPHQLHALAWLKWRETQRPCAGILADDMGLGKTITMISLVASDKEGKIDHDDEDDDVDGPPAKGKLIRGGTLVVCPASLIQQWAGEVGKHCTPHSVSIGLHHGASRPTQPHRLATYDMVATTYNILQRDSEKNGVLMRVQWRRVILDEAHIVRNHKSATSAAVCALRAARRWCLTGTPVQNKDLDLFALLKFLRCSPFDDLQMWKKWIDNKSQGGQERLSTIMRCILLRRTKVQLQQSGQLACLPSRSPHLMEVTLSQQEMNVYQKVLVLSKSLFAQFLHQRAEKNADSTSFASKQQDSEYHKMHKRMMALQGVKPVKSHEILVLLLRLRQVCCHCGLIAAMLDEETAAQPTDTASEDLLQELDKLSLDESRSRRKSGNQKEDVENEEPQESATATEAIRAVLSPNNPVFELSRPSSKIRAVMDCLNNNVFANKGDKAVVVSQWTSVLRLVEAELSTRRVRSVTLSGSVPVPARPALIHAVNDPNSDVKVMLLSLCAGGVGINLCGANHLLLLDPHWNPQLEEQAQDRIYRVGQKKDVHIYRFMCVGTVEQTIRKLQEAKLQLAENVLTGARNTATSTLSIEDLKMLFNMG